MRSIQEMLSESELQDDLRWAPNKVINDSVIRSLDIPGDCTYLDMTSAHSVLGVTICTVRVTTCTPRVTNCTRSVSVYTPRVSIYTARMTTCASILSGRPFVLPG